MDLGNSLWPFSSHARGRMYNVLIKALTVLLRGQDSIATIYMSTGNMNSLCLEAMKLGVPSYEVREL